MVGLSHVGLRMITRKYLPAGARTYWPTEMLNSRKLPLQTLGATPETFRDSIEQDLTPQILGNEEGPIADSVQQLEAWGVKGIDINMGCPVRKALRHNYGVALMGDPSYAANVVKMAVKSTRLPVSVKIRAGFQRDSDFLIRFVEGLVDSGAAWVCLHPRTVEQKRRGNADWEQIKILRGSVPIPIVGNGDIQVAEDALTMLNTTACDAVMIGRACTVRPWIFWQIGRALGWPNPPGIIGDPPSTPEEEAKAYGESLKELLEVLQRFFPEDLGVRRFQFHVKVSHPWLNFGHDLMTRVSRSQNFLMLGETLDLFFRSERLRLSQRTDLRY
jgi:tRNA-dihydrouridine synthase B